MDYDLNTGLVLRSHLTVAVFYNPIHGCGFIEIRHKKVSPTHMLSALGCLSLSLCGQ